MSQELREEPKKLQEITQIIPETGMSQDYINDLITLGSLIKHGNRELFITAIKEIKWQPQKYEEHFPSNKFVNPITDKNREAVTKLNSIVEKFLQKFPFGFADLTIDEFKEYARSIVDIVHPGRKWML